MSNIDSMNMYLNVFQSFGTPLILLDNNNRVYDFNRYALEFFPSLVKGISIPDSVKYLKTVFEKSKDFFEGEKSELSFETAVPTSSGQKFFKIKLSKTFDSREVFIGSVLILEDMTKIRTARQKLENAKLRAEEADQMKTSFLANMSHEIRTPMNAIVGFTELMINGNHGKTEQKEYLELVRRSSNNLLNIIEDIIDIAKLEAKQLKIKYKECKPYDLLKDLLLVFKEMTHKYQIQDSVQLILSVREADQDIVLFTDGERLKQLISNLLTNAAKFTRRGSIEFGYKKNGNSHLNFFVRDSGTGIPNAVQKKIFERFFQVEEHLTLNMGGAGLGLTICKNIVDLLGGKIWVESVYGRGSEFYIQLPIRDVPPHLLLIEKESPEIEIQELHDWRNRNILIAEDDEMNYLYISELLKSTGANLIRAKNGLEAINFTESIEDIDLILMDIKMPEIDGYEATKYIVNIRPCIPIIALTAYALHGDKVKCLDAGCVGYLTKPVIKERLFTILHKHLSSDKMELMVNPFSRVK